MLLDQASQALLDDVGIDLRRRDVGMAEELLHRAQIGATLQEVAGKGVAENVRRDARGFDPRGESERLQFLSKALAGEMLASARRKEPDRGAAPFSLIGADRGEMGLERSLRRLVQGYEALAPAFALDGQHPVVRREHVARQRDQLRHAQARGIERFERGIESERAAPPDSLFGVLARVLGGLEQRLDLGKRENLGQRPAEARTVDRRAGIAAAQALAEQKAEELADGRELSRAGGRRQTFASESGEIGADMIGRHCLRVLALGGEEGEKIGKVAGIGLDRMSRRAALGGQDVEEERKFRGVFPALRASYGQGSSLSVAGKARAARWGKLTARGGPKTRPPREERPRRASPPWSPRAGP